MNFTCTNVEGLFTESAINEVSICHEAWILIKYALHTIAVKITELVFFVLFNLKRNVNALQAIFVVCDAS